ncbi:helix-turn-helix domain-containing protein [Aliiroseovarius sp. PTFE2010]|uniref:arsenate reductase/protein-tyrosine-phosphatase family protein n=1 Tax=Aliiroseovarius sp. PTFE2010 TaxID=3417190 RepID=UPI003CEE8D62
MEDMILSRLTILGHPQRMAVLRLLMRRYPDQLPAGEIATVLRLKANTLSIYLSALREAGLISQQRRGKSVLCQANVMGVQQIVDYLFIDCCRGRADLCLPEAQTRMSKLSDGRYNVLFICVGNSARSIFAEALLRKIGGDRFNAYSAGTKPNSQLNPTALEMLGDKGHDLTRLRAKTVAEFQGPDAIAMDFVFTVCDQAANEDCPPWPGQPISAHWGMPDPVKATGSDAEKTLAFQQAYGALKHRIEAFTALRPDQLNRQSLQDAVDQIGQHTNTMEIE